MITRPRQDPLRPRARDLPVLLVSANARPAAITTGVTAGADAYLPKPFTLHELRSMIRTLLTVGRPDRLATRRQRIAAHEMTWSTPAPSLSARPRACHSAAG